MALAERMLNARFGDGLVDHRTYVIAGDGYLMEGISHEAFALAGHLKLNRLIVLLGRQRISIDGSTSLADSDRSASASRPDGWAAWTATTWRQSLTAAQKRKRATGRR